MGDKDGCHGLVERGAVHVDCGPDRQHKADDASVDVVVLEEALEGDRQSGRAAAGKDNDNLRSISWKCLLQKLVQL